MSSCQPRSDHGLLPQPFFGMLPGQGEPGMQAGDQPMLQDLTLPIFLAECFEETETM